MKKLMQRVRGVVLGFAVAGGMAASSAGAAETWDLSTEFNERYLFGDGYKYFAEQLESRTGGDIKVMVHYGSALGYKSSDHLELVGQGAVQIADTYSGALSGVDPVFKLSSLPFLARSVDDAYDLYQAAKPHYEAFFEKHGQVLLFTSFHPPSGLWATKPLTSVEDMKGLRIRTYDPAGDETMRNIGAAPIQMNISDVIAQLASGGISSVLTSAEGAVSFKFEEFMKNFTEINYAVPLQFMHVNKGIFESLSPETQAVLREVSAETEAMNWQAGRDAKVKVYAAMRTAGVEIVETPSEAFIEALAEAGNPVVAAWQEEVGETAAKILAERDRIQAE